MPHLLVLGVIIDLEQRIQSVWFLEAEDDLQAAPVLFTQCAAAHLRGSRRERGQMGHTRPWCRNFLCSVSSGRLTGPA